MEVQKLSGSSKRKSKKGRQYSDNEIAILRDAFKHHMLTAKLDEEYEVFPDDWRVYSWNDGDQCEPMHPHDALLLELEGKVLTDMTEKHGIRPAHLKMLERKKQREFWERA